MKPAIVVRNSRWFTNLFFLVGVGVWFTLTALPTFAVAILAHVPQIRTAINWTSGLATGP